MDRPAEHAVHRGGSLMDKRVRRAILAVQGTRDHWFEGDGRFCTSWGPETGPKVLRVRVRCGRPREAHPWPAFELPSVPDSEGVSPADPC